MPRTLPAALTTAFNSLVGNPVFTVTITNTVTLATTYTGQVTKYKLKPLSLEVTVQTSTYIDVSTDDLLVFTRGMTVSGVTYTIDTSNLYIISSYWTGSFQTFTCHIVPEKYYTASGYDTYQNIIEAFCTTFGKTAAFKDTGAAWLSYKFFPSGRSLTLNNAQKFFDILRQKYFIYATDNGGDEILFYTAFNANTTADHTANAAHWKVDYEDTIKRRFIWRDENGTIHGSDPSYYQIKSFDAVNTGLIESIIRLSDNSILAGGYITGESRRVYRSTDEGVTWTAGTGFPSLGTPGAIKDLCEVGGGVVIALATQPARVYRSTNYGVTWSHITQLGAAAASNAYEVTTDGTNVWAIVDDVANGRKAFKSADSGATWNAGTVVNAGISEAISIYWVSGNILLIGAYQGTGYTYRSTDGGVNWTAVSTAARLRNFFQISTTIYATETETGDIYKSIDSGASWVIHSSAIDAVKIIPLTATNWIASADTDGGLISGDSFYESANGGTTWSALRLNDGVSIANDFIHRSDKSFFVAYYLTSDRKAEIYLFDADNIQEYPVHNLGYLESTDSAPNRNQTFSQPTFDPFPIHLKYISSDHVTINLLPTTEVFEARRAEIIEEFDSKFTTIPWRVTIEPTDWLSTTEAGSLPSTIEQAAPYTPLATFGFNGNLDASVNNLQALADKVDDMTIPSSPIDAPTATNDFLIGAQVATVWTWVKNTLAQTITILRTSLDSIYQPLDSDLTAIAAIAPANDDVIQRKAGAWVNRTIAQLVTDIRTVLDSIYAAASHTHAYTALTSKPTEITNANALFGVSACSSSGFTATIATLPGGAPTTLTYTPVSGNEDTLNPTATTQLGKQRLYNTARGNSVGLISSNNAGTNTTTLTANVPAGWVVGDTITTLSPTIATAGFVDIELTSGDFLNKSFVDIAMNILDTGGAGAILRHHPFTGSVSTAKYKAVTTQSTQRANIEYHYSLISNVLSVFWQATGAGTATFAIVESAQFE